MHLMEIKMEMIEARVCRRGMDEPAMEDCFAAPGLNIQAIREQLFDQFNAFRDDEILEGVTVGGIYVCPETFEWKLVRVSTDGIAEHLPEAPTSEEINVALEGLVRNPFAVASYVNDPITVTRP